MLFGFPVECRLFERSTSAVSTAMFLIRSAFWLALLVAILPSDPREQARLYQTASQALHHAATFCDRNGSLCQEAEVHFAAFKVKLAVGARMAADLVNERLTGSSPRLAVPSDGPLPAADTLSPADRLPAWRGGPRTQL
ncbi:MAG: hypothetical protein SFW09_19395 [Hyphomicrobiaceae bacterium]|nr:hypothetical protein [Hyphomicrobiaceae bacterium]